MEGTRKARVPMAEQIRLINECRQSGMTDADWCRENDIAIDQIVDAPVLSDDFSGEIPEYLFAADISDKVFIGLFVDDADGSALFPEFIGDASADPLCAAGDNGDFILKHISFSFLTDHINLNRFFRNSRIPSSRIFPSSFDSALRSTFR